LPSASADGIIAVLFGFSHIPLSKNVAKAICFFNLYRQLKLTAMDRKRTFWTSSFNTKTHANNGGDALR